MLKVTFFFITAIMMVSVPLAMGYVPDSPKSQYTEGTDPHDVICNESLELVFKNSDNSPACVKSTSVSKLVERGWASGHAPSMNKLDYFDEKMELVDKINDKLRQFLDKSSDISLPESYKELAKCNQFAKETEKKLTIKNMSKDNARATDYAAFYMCKCQLEMYRHATLLALAFNLQEELNKQQKSKKKKGHENKFAKISNEK